MPSGRTRPAGERGIGGPPPARHRARKRLKRGAADPDNDRAESPHRERPLPLSVETLLEREKSLREQFGALLTVSRAVANTLDLNTVLSTIAKQIRQVIQTDECTVFVYDE